MLDEFVAVDEKSRLTGWRAAMQRRGITNMVCRALCHRLVRLAGRRRPTHAAVLSFCGIAGR
jgi:hypothetical protein